MAYIRYGTNTLMLCQYLALLSWIFGNGICPFLVVPWILVYVFFFMNLVSNLWHVNYILLTCLCCILCIHIRDICEHVTLAETLQ